MQEGLARTGRFLRRYWFWGVLVLAGALDDKYTAITKEVAARIETVRRVVIPQAGHNIHAERPAAFRDVLRPFLPETEE